MVDKNGKQIFNKITTIKQLILDIKRIQFQIEAILDRGMTSRTNLKALAVDQIKMIGGIPLTSNEAKRIVEECEITGKNELILKYFDFVRSQG